jgi:hypothetical protein
LRKEDRDLWDKMVQEVKQRYAEAVGQSGKPLTVDAFFMALLLAQQRTIEFLEAQLKEGKASTKAWVQLREVVQESLGDTQEDT